MVKETTMKKLFIVISILSSIMLLASCEEAQSHETLRINLASDSSRSILPEDFPLNIVSYRITGSGPAGASLDIETSKTSTTVDGMAVGEWELQATALNENGDALVRGSTEVRITGRSANTTIYLDELIGKGDVTINLSWDPDVLTSDPVIIVEFIPEYDGTEVDNLTEYSINKAEGTAVYKGTDYPSGSYRLSARLYEQGKPEALAGFTEVVRVADGQTSVGTIEFDMDKYPSEPTPIELVNTTGVPVKLTITGLSDTVTAGIPITVSLTSDSDIESFQITWHLNGEMIGDGESIELTPSEGVHRLDAVASTSRTGASGSASFNFEAIAAADIGAPNQGNIIYESSSDIEMGQTMAVEFLPNGEVIIASNTSRVLQICSVVRSSLVLEKSYPYDDIGIDAGQTIADIAAGEVTTKEYSIFAIMNSPIEAAVYSYSPETRAMTLSVKGMTGDDISTGSGEFTPANALFAGINTERNAGIAIFGDQTRRYAGAFLFTLDAATTSIFEDTDEKNFLGMFTEGYPEFFDYDDTMIIAGETAYFAGYADKGTEELYTQYLAPLSLVDEYESVLSNTEGVAILSNDNVLIVGDNAVIVNGGNAWNDYESEPLGFKASAVSVTADQRYVYMIDEDDGALVSYKVLDSGTRIEEFSKTQTKGENLDSIRISASGHTILLYDDSACDAITVMSVNR